MVNLKLVKSLIKVLGKTDKINILVPGDSLEKILSSGKDLRQSDLSSVIFSLPHRLPMIVKPKLYKFCAAHPRESSSTIGTIETNKSKNTGFNTESGDDSQLVDQPLIMLTEANQSVQSVAQSKVSFSYAEQAQEQAQAQSV